MKEKFYRFLEKHNAVETWEDCVADGGWTTKTELLNGDYERYLVDAFSWSETVDGFNYWSGLDAMWHDYVRNSEMEELKEKQNNELTDAVNSIKETLASMDEKYNKIIELLTKEK